MVFFSPKLPIAKREYEWLLACFAWLQTVLDDREITPALVLPDHPDIVAATTAQELFDTVRDLMGMAEWPCRLEKVAVDVETDELGFETTRMNACGTFSIEGGEAVIRYSDAMLRNPEGLTATLAHELCHYLLANAGDPPGGPELMEHSTDCAAAYLGFGVFLANNARTYMAWSDGLASMHQTATNGYLSEAALTTATVLFAELRGHSLVDAERQLKPYLKKDMRKALAYVHRNDPDVQAALDQVDLLDWSY